MLVDGGRWRRAVAGLDPALRRRFRRADRAQARQGAARVAIEAQAMGRLVIATDHGGARETIIPNETGYLVPPEDANMMAEAIKFALARDEKEVKVMADYARQHVRKNFSSERMKADTIAVYRELLG